MSDHLHENTHESFSTIETDPAKAMKLATKWAAKAIDNNYLKSTVTSALFPVWELEFQRRFSSGDTWSPYGQMNIGTMFYRLTDDGDSAFDWWTVEFHTEAVPGAFAYSGKTWCAISSARRYLTTLPRV
jgi:hypothetical protein